MEKTPTFFGADKKKDKNFYKREAEAFFTGQRDISVCERSDYNETQLPLKDQC